MNIVVTGENPKLPKVYITKAILQNNSISISLDIEEGSESSVNNFSNNDYFEYLKFDISLLSGDFIVGTETIQINDLPSTIGLVFSDIDTSGLLSISIRTYFESGRYVSDNNITDRTLIYLVYNILGLQVTIDYPVLDDNGDLYTNLLDVNGNTVQSIVSDYRSVTELENLNFVSPSTREDKPKYFNFVKSDVVGTKVNNFVSFNYRKFLENNSFFSSSDFENYNIQITISNSLKSLENLIISNNRNTFLSSSGNTRLISKSNETILFYF